MTSYRNVLSSVKRESSKTKVHVVLFSGDTFLGGISCSILLHHLSFFFSPPRQTFMNRSSISRLGALMSFDASLAVFKHSVVYLDPSRLFFHLRFSNGPECANWNDVWVSASASLFRLVASDSRCWLTGAEPDEVFCSCSTSSSRFGKLCVLRSFSAHCGCKEWVVDPLCTFFVSSNKPGYSPLSAELWSKSLRSRVPLCCSQNTFKRKFLPFYLLLMVNTSGWNE